jgi:two-component system, sensor histidine kinase and response regulator
MKKPLKILIVDDDEVDRMAICRALKATDVLSELAEASSCAEALSTLKQTSFDCAFLDYRLPDRNGLALMQIMQEQGMQCPVIMLTGQGDEQIAVELMKAGATDYLTKSHISPERLAKTLRSALRIYQAEQQAALANQQLQESYRLLMQKNQELKEQQQQIQSQNLQLKQSIAEREQMALQQKDFISHLTHDLRTPLFASDTVLKMFQQEAFCPLSADMHTAIVAMIRSNHNLIQIVDTLLEVHCYEAGMKNLNFMPCDLEAIANEVVQELLPLAEDKGIALRLQKKAILTSAEKSSTLVQGDFLELRRMLTNLVGNSIKFTQTGAVELRLIPSFLSPNPSEQPHQFPRQWITLEVEDTGFGISEAEQATLFERFRKGIHKQAGSGLGLHLVHRILQVHQGRIKVRSQVGQGSLFTVCLPARFT